MRCGLCLHGCPRGLIYNAAPSRAHLLERGLVLQTGITVRAVRETADGVMVHAIGADGRAHGIAGACVFLAAGPLNTTEIVLRSLGWFDRTVAIKDSQHVLMPMLCLQETPGVEDERLHTLAQAKPNFGSSARCWPRAASFFVSDWFSDREWSPRRGRIRSKGPACSARSAPPSGGRGSWR